MSHTTDLREFEIFKILIAEGVQIISLTWTWCSDWQFGQSRRRFLCCCLWGLPVEDSDFDWAQPTCCLSLVFHWDGCHLKPCKKKNLHCEKGQYHMQLNYLWSNTLDFLNCDLFAKSSHLDSCLKCAGLKCAASIYESLRLILGKPISSTLKTHNLFIRSPKNAF